MKHAYDRGTFMVATVNLGTQDNPWSHGHWGCLYLDKPLSYVSKNNAPNVNLYTNSRNQKGGSNYTNSCNEMNESKLLDRMPAENDGQSSN